MIAPDELLKFWLDDVGPAGWYQSSEALDQEIRDRFASAWEHACDGAYGLWLTYPSGALAYIILMDQFPRNMFRGQGRAFDSDRVALAAAKMSISQGWDMRIDEPARQFFYLPLMHSENLCDQDRCVRLMAERMPEHGAPNMLHAKAHREVIRRFGRFPYRNEALARRASAPEQRYMADGGYGATVRKLTPAE
ncbi:DUF924 domain-containing protein [Pseudooceanicola sp. CBS1P-1]|uniref:DUF924 family protein n=1 Tax=Pseudooceanicola albus TaxID=2692189 RepID=A0A6L7GBE1_9RHOB|nr:MULTISPECIES: DUF924 family protein [Pseudooceanicola]MBT9384433.1 DUF924 domain-containing protein [Pseudooceanicola endophyticus]MXN20666.1 DUF924 family protein [Pseudooceanicola albus]